jgi:hypothetical protein
MRVRSISVLLPAAVALVAAGCAKSSTAPSTPTAAPVLMTPTNGSQLPNVGQPVTLVVQNAAGSKAGTTYTFEVSAEVAFTTKVQTKDGIPEGSVGFTSTQLDPLPAGATYYWRARAQAPGSTGTFSDLFKFSLGGAVTLGSPSPISPLTNAETSVRPALRVTNVSRSGPTGALSYKFDIARDANFGAIVMSGTNSEGINETGFIPPSDLPTNTLLFWRATVSDAANFLTSGASTTQSFTPLPPSQAEVLAQQIGQTLWPGQVPPGSRGHATMGENWAVQTLHYVPGNVDFKSPDIEMLRVFDLLDRGYDPEGAAAWMNANGYPTAALWYPPPEKAVIGLKYVYLASRNKVYVNGTWDVVLRVE